MVRSPTQPILHYYGQTWDAVNKPAEAFYSHLHKTIFIKSYQPDLLRFLKLNIHEIHHHLGYDHGEEMHALDKARIGKARSELSYLWAE